MDRREIASGVATPGSSPAALSAGFIRRLDKDIGDDDDGGWEVPDSPLKPKRKCPERRQLMLKVQLMVCLSL